jgi:glycosyltransferase involved in cell wall biosynthesis
MTRPILIVSGDFVETGGMDRANHALADHLSRRGDEVHLVAYRAAADLLARPNLTLHAVNKPFQSYTLGGPVLNRRGRDEAARVAARGGRVIVNGGNCRWGDVNWVHHLNVLDVPQPGGSPLRRLKTRLDYRVHVGAERRALTVARQVVTTCEKNRDDLARHFGMPADRIEVVYYGTDPSAFRPAAPGERTALRERFGWPGDRPTYLFVGGLGADRRKGFDTLFAAWALLCGDATWAADLVVVGDGAERPAWQKAASEAGLGERIRFLGFRRDVPDLFRACDAHVLPSRYEGYSLVTQEALCCGLPAFVTRTAGIAERFEGDLADALLIPDPDDAPALADRLRAWQARAESARPALEAFSGRLRAYTWDHMAGRIAAVIAERPQAVRTGPSPSRI